MRNEDFSAFIRRPIYYQIDGQFPAGDHTPPVGRIDIRRKRDMNFVPAAKSSAPQ